MVTQECPRCCEKYELSSDFFYRRKDSQADLVMFAKNVKTKELKKRETNIVIKTRRKFLRSIRNIVKHIKKKSQNIEGDTLLRIGTESILVVENMESQIKEGHIQGSTDKITGANLLSILGLIGPIIKIK